MPNVSKIWFIQDILLVLLVDDGRRRVISINEMNPKSVSPWENYPLFGCCNCCSLKHARNWKTIQGTKWFISSVTLKMMLLQYYTRVRFYRTHWIYKCDNCMFHSRIYYSSFTFLFYSVWCFMVAQHTNEKNPPNRGSKVILILTWEYCIRF